MKKNDILIFLISIILLPNFGCDSRDEFYTKKGGWDYQRIPLIKPCYATKTDGSYYWGITFPYDSGIFNIFSTDVTLIDVHDSIIFIKWTIDTSMVNYTDTTWSFVSIPHKVAYSFKNEEEYIDSINRHTHYKPRYKSIEDVWIQFRETGYLEWFPEEYKK